MATKTKTFDCVEMKNRIQRELRGEYEARKSEFASYADFLNKTTEADSEVRAFRERLTRFAEERKG